MGNGNSSSFEPDLEKLIESWKSKKENPETKLGKLLDSKCIEATRLEEAFPNIFKLVDFNYRGHQVVVKKVGYVPNSGAEFDYMKREWELVQKLQREEEAHENLLQLYAVGTAKDSTYLVLELGAGSLFELFPPENYPLKKYTGEKPSDLKMLYEIACGLAFLHSKNIIHRDIKPQNIIFSLKTDDRGVLMKVADFGCIKPTKPTGSCSWTADCGTSDWRAPEMMGWKTRAAELSGSNPRITNKVDVFSFGLVAYWLLTEGKHPFGSGLMVSANIKNYDVEADFDELLPDAVYNKLVRDMIAQKPEERPTMEEVKQQLESLMSNNL